MRLDLLLANSAQVDTTGGTVHALGLGWTTTSTPTPPSALVILLWMSWTEANERFDFRAELVDSDGKPVTGGDGEPVAFWGQTEVGRPAGMRPGSEIMTPLVVGLDRGLLLQPGGRYEWRMSVQTKPPKVATASFTVREFPG